MKTRKVKYDKPQDSSFQKTLNKKVKAYFEENDISPKANKLMVLKIIVYGALFFSTYGLILSNQFSLLTLLALTIAFGMISSLIGFNIGHDAVHGALFKSKMWNRFFSYSFELVGMSHYTWYIKHNLVHHNYPNVVGVDFDIDASPVLRFSPADKLRKFHRAQHLYSPIVYMLFSLLLIFFNDFRIVFGTKRESIDGRPHPVREKIIIIVSKTAYIFFTLVLPIIVLDIGWWQVVVGFLIMHAVLSIVLALVLIPSHIFENTQFYRKDGDGIVNSGWAMAQVQTTIDYSRKSKLCNLLLGGLNINVVHHLFPHICHVHLIALSDIVKETAERYNVEYNETSIWGAISSHFRALKILGRTNEPVIAGK